MVTMYAVCVRMSGELCWLDLTGTRNGSYTRNLLALSLTTDKEYANKMKDSFAFARSGLCVFNLTIPLA